MGDFIVRTDLKRTNGEETISVANKISYRAQAYAASGMLEQALADYIRA